MSPAPSSTPGRCRGDGFDFDREAESLGEAIISAVRDVEKVDGVQVTRVADAGLVSMTDIAPPAWDVLAKASGCSSRERGDRVASRLPLPTRAAATGSGAGPTSRTGSRRGSVTTVCRTTISSPRSMQAWNFAGTSTSSQVLVGAA